MKLLKFSGNLLAPALEEPLSEVMLDDWRANRQAHAGATALAIPNDASLGDIVEDLSGFSTVILTFPTFKDGRAYSQARIIRERFFYTGEIRARGDVLRDQILFMTRCGFDAFEFESGDANDALGEFSFAYQASADRVEPVWRQRLSRAAAA